MTSPQTASNYLETMIKRDERDRYLDRGRDFIDDVEIERLLERHRRPDPARVREVLAKSLELQRLEPAECAVLLNIEDPELWEEVFKTALAIKLNVYGRRIVTFAPLYCSNVCVNNCAYCGFRRENQDQLRRRLSIDEVKEEVKAIVRVGHKRLIMVYGEHPSSDYRYIADTIRAAYEVKEGRGEIRRVNINAAPQAVEGFRALKEVGIGTYQVFQETYHHATYKQVHPAGTVKGDYAWRLYSLHRAQEAGIDDVAIGALFGLYDWKFEVMGLLHHAIDLEKNFAGVGPHTISFPRMTPSQNCAITENSPYKVSDADFKKVVAVIRLSVPYTGMILTAREPAHVRREILDLAATQTDAATRIGVGAYAEAAKGQAQNRQQFTLGDIRGLEEVVRELAEMGYLTSFCTADYRCGRTGTHFMNIAKKGKIHNLCIPNGILTFMEYLIDYASPETRAIGEKLIEERILDTPEHMREAIRARLREIENGSRDLFF